MLDLNKIRQEIECFSEEIEKEFYLNYAGLKEELNTSPIYEKYKHLFTNNLIAQIKEQRQSVVGEDKRKLRYIQAFSTKGYLDMGVKELTDISKTMETKEVVRIDDKEIPFRLAAIKMANEPNREIRKKIFKARNDIIDKINVILKERTKRLHKLSEKLGYKNYISLYQDVDNIDFYILNSIMKKFIERTDSLYEKRMDEALTEKLKIKIHDAEKHDISFFFRASEYDLYFKKERLLKTLKKTLKNMSINLDEQDNIKIDIKERPRKSSRAFTSLIKVPEEIILVIMPKGGHDDYASILHECGHTEHFGHVDSSQPIEYKRLGEYSVTESYAFLFEYLMNDKNWLDQHTSMTNIKKYLEFAYLYKLYFLRRYGAKLSYELQLHKDGLDGMDIIYKQMLESSLKFKHPKNHYLIDVDDGFYVAQYLRAWIFEAQLRAKLKEKYGERWFNNFNAGKFLKNLWSEGQKYDVIELARRLGYEGLDIQPLEVEIEDHLK